MASYTSSIPGSDIQAASIPNAQLTNSNMDLLVNLQYINMAGSATIASTTIPAAVFGLSNLSADTASYVVNSASYLMTDCGTASSTIFHVEWGSYVAGVWTQIGANIIAATTVTPPASDDQGVTGTPTITTATIPMQTSIRGWLALFITQVATNALTGTIADGGAPSLLAVAMSLKRTGGLRS